MSKARRSVTDRNVSDRAIKKLPLVMAFLIPVFILLVLYIGRGIFPFGENMYLRSDMYHQYAPFMKEFQRNIQTGGSLLYSWNIGLGTNFASTYAYYLASPLNWLVGIFPDNLVPEFMNIMLILKSGLMSVSFAYYLVRKYRRNDYISTAFGCFYAMSAYMAAYSWNVMWLDCLVVFPFILMGLEALVRKGKFRMYVIALALSIISNYYISIMICFFLIFYFIYLMICENNIRDKYENIRRCCMFILTSVLAGCMAMFVVLPALFNLFITASADSAFPTYFTAYYNVLEMLAKAVINTEPAVFSGHFPNIYSTMALFMMVPLFWFARRVPAKEKAGKTLLVCFLAFTFMFNIPTYIWHGFHFPNSLPCRYSFIFIFMVLVMGYQAFITMRRFTYKEIVGCAAAGIGCVFLLQTLYSDSIILGNAFLAALFILLYLLIAVLLKNRRAGKTLIMVLLMLVTIAEIVINTNNTGYSTTSRTVYYSDNNSIRSMLDQVDDGSFYRVEKVSRRTKNDGTWNDYRSASIFSSTTVAGNSDMYDDLGLQGRFNAYSYYGHTPVTQAILGVRYEIANEEQSDPLMTKAAEVNRYYLYENKYYLSLGFMTDLKEGEIYYSTSDPFTNQNELVNSMCGTDNIFSVLGAMSGSDVKFDVDKDGRCLIYITNDVDSCIVEITRDEEIVFNETYDSIEYPQIIDALDVQAGDHITVFSNDQDADNISVTPAIMDYEKYEEAMEKLSACQLDIEEYGDTYVKGTVNVTGRHTMLTTIPYDEGWTVSVDGNKIEYIDFKNSFIMFNIDEGTHTVEFKYWPTGLTAGAIISLAALAVFIIAALFYGRERRRKR